MTGLREKREGALLWFLGNHGWRTTLGLKHGNHTKAKNAGCVAVVCNGEEEALWNFVWT